MNGQGATFGYASIIVNHAQNGQNIYRESTTSNLKKCMDKSNKLQANNTTYFAAKIIRE